MDLAFKLADKQIFTTENGMGLLILFSIYKTAIHLT